MPILDKAHSGIAIKINGLKHEKYKKYGLKTIRLRYPHVLM